MKKAYISLGANKGLEFLTFQKSKLYEEDYEFHAFEPEPRCFNLIEKVAAELAPHKFYHHKVAVGTYDGEASFQVGQTSLSGTLRRDKKGRVTGEIANVQIIDFPKWLSENFTLEDYIVMTIDIEGAEYDLFPYMLEKGSFEYINKIGIEFHSHKLKSDNSVVEDFLIRTLTEKFGEDLYLGWIESGDGIEYANKHWGPHPKANRPHLDKNMFNNF